MELQQAQNISQQIIKKLEPFCSRIEVAGSIRRKKQFPRDIDIVLIPGNQGKLLNALQSLGPLKSGAGKLLRIELQYGYPVGLMLDVYIAAPETWATLLLIRTGSKEHNIKLCSLARQQGMVLHADGSGLFRIEPFNNVPVRIAGDTEESIFQALGLKYLKPEERN